MFNQDKPKVGPCEQTNGEIAVKAESSYKCGSRIFLSSTWYR